MPAKTKVTKDLLVDIARNLFRTKTVRDLEVAHGVSIGKIERLAAHLRRAGANIPKKARVYKNSLAMLIQDVKNDNPEAFA